MLCNVHVHAHHAVDDEQNQEPGVGTVSKPHAKSCGVRLGTVFWILVAALALWLIHSYWTDDDWEEMESAPPLSSEQEPKNPGELTYEQVVQRVRSIPKLKGEISHGFLELAKDKQFIEGAGAAFFRKFGKLTKQQVKDGALEHWAKVMFMIRMEDVDFIGSKTAWKCGGSKLSRNMTIDLIDPTNGWCDTFNGQTDHLDLNRYIAMVRAGCFMVSLPGWYQMWTDLPDLGVLHIECLNEGKPFDYSMLQLPENYTKRCPDFTLQFVMDKFSLGWARRFLPMKDFDGKL